MGRHVSVAMQKLEHGVTHRERLALIHRELPDVRVLPISYPWAGTFVNDYFGEHLDRRKGDQNSIYAGAFARELRALAEQEGELPVDLDDGTEVRAFIESQTRSRRKPSGAWS